MQQLRLLHKIQQQEMAKNSEMEKKKELAKILFLNGEPQKEISDKVGVSQQTVGKWVSANNWSEMRAAKTVTRKEIVAKMLGELAKKLDSGEYNADEIAKASAAIERLDKQTNVVTVIEVFSAYNNWLVSRMGVDKELTPELVKVMNKYQDIFIGESLSTVKII